MINLTPDSRKFCDSPAARKRHSDERKIQHSISPSRTIRREDAFRHSKSFNPSRFVTNLASLHGRNIGVGFELHAGVAQRQAETSVRVDTTASISSAEALRAAYSRSVARWWHIKTPKQRCTVQLLKWAGESRRANLTLPEILERQKWDGGTVERL
jgi:hypothetical protein